MISSAAQRIRQTLERDVLGSGSIAEKRQQWEAAARAEPTPSGVNLSYTDIGGVPCLITVPDKTDPSRIILYCHGGGLVEGSVHTFRVWTSRLARHTGCQVVSIDYRLAPENPYPAALDDVLAVYRAILSAENHGSKICLGADSTGSNLALAALYKLESDFKQKIHALFLLSPSIDLTFSGDAIHANAEVDPVVSLDVLEHYAELYAGNSELSEPTVSPLFAEFEHPPPLLVMVDNNEMLRDDAVRLVDKFNAVAGYTELVVTEGLWHVWPCWGDFPEAEIALDSIRKHVLCATYARSDRQL